MDNTTTTGTLTLFSIRGDPGIDGSCSLFIVAANDADEATDLVVEYTNRVFGRGEDMDVTTETVDAIGTLIDAEPKVLDSSAT